MRSTIVGKVGRGKTTLAKTLLTSRSFDRTYILDYLGEYHNFQSESVFVQAPGLRSFCNKVWDESSTDHSSMVLFDEIDLYGKNDFRIEHLYRYGRHKNIDIIAVARRFYDLPVYVRAYTDVFHIFQISEPRDIEYLKWYIPKSWIPIIVNLKPFTYINVVL